MVQGVAMVIAVVIVLVNLLTDILYVSSIPESDSNGQRHERRGGRTCRAHVAGRASPSAFPASHRLVFRLCRDRRSCSPPSGSHRAAGSERSEPPRRRQRSQRGVLARHRRPRSRHLFAPHRGRAYGGRGAAPHRPRRDGHRKLLGLLAGYRGGWADAGIMRWVDLMYALPGSAGGHRRRGRARRRLLLGRGPARSSLTSPYDTRLVRGGDARAAPAAVRRSRRTLGLSRPRIMVRHIWPNIPPLVVANTFLTSPSRWSRSRRCHSSGSASAPARPTGAGCSPRAERSSSTTRRPLSRRA